jgi:hypothetical protein
MSSPLHGKNPHKVNPPWWCTQLYSNFECMCFYECVVKDRFVQGPGVLETNRYRNSFLKQYILLGLTPQLSPYGFS